MPLTLVKKPSEELAELIQQVEKDRLKDKLEQMRRLGEIEGLTKGHPNDLTRGVSIVMQLTIHESEARRDDDLTIMKTLHIIAVSLEATLDRINQDGDVDRQRLTTLLGLPRDATREDIADAIDDVAPLFADYRKKKRGV